MDLITVDNISTVFPRPLEDDEETRAEGLIQAALDLIEEAFLRHGRDFYEEATDSRLLQLTVKRVVREMISKAIHVGDNVGRQSATSTTGPQSDSVTWSQGVGIHWGGVYLTDRWLRDLGLMSQAGVGYRFPRAKRYAEPVAYRRDVLGAEFSERRRTR